MGVSRVALPIAVLALGLVGASVASADVVVKQKFLAESADKCGVTKGVFAWYPSPKIDVTGVLHDLPCNDDKRFSTATFVAYASGRAVDEQLVRADDGPTDFVFQLDNSVSLAPIERVTVQVCRPPVEVGIPVICGPLEEYRSPR